jgi:hypothetical protein
MCGFVGQRARLTRFWATVALLVAVALPAARCFGQNNNNNNNNNNNGGGATTPTIGTGFIFSNRAVGGVAIDARGVIQNVAVETNGRLGGKRAEALAEIPGELNQPGKLRKVSLRRLEDAIEKHLLDRAPLNEEIVCLAGLQEIRYVFLYPEQNDIVLAGFGEGWQTDAAGNVVGVTTGRPVLMLDDLLVALRGAEAAARTGISCSIDPTQEGLDRLQQFLNAQGNTIGANPDATISGIEESLGPQVVSITGVPATTHFAQVMVAADYRMKRLAMNLDASPVRGLTSYLKMSNGHGSMMPRWWLEPDFDPLVRDADGLAWEIGVPRVKAVTEDDYLAANGQRQHSGKASPMAQRWADTMTKHYDELSLRMPIFADLRNVMSLAVVAALVVKENLADKAGCPLPVLLDSSAVQVAQLAAPREVPTQASFMKKGDNWIISASGGVLINSWAIAQRTAIDQKKQLAPLRSRAAAKAGGSWWWN